MKFCLSILFLTICCSSSCQDSLWIFYTEQGDGFIDKRGQFRIRPIYKYLDDFHDGLAYFEDSVGSGFIDTKGEIAFRTSYKTSFNEGLAFIKIKDSINFINKKGEIVVKPIYKDYIVGCETNCYAYYSEGLASVVITTTDKTNWHNYIYIDKIGTPVFNQTYKYAQNFSEGLAFVMFNNNSCGYINKFGELVIKLNSVQRGEEFSEGYALLIDKSNNYYYIDKNGLRLGNWLFKNAESFSNGMAKVSFSVGWPPEWGYINQKGELIIKPQYSSATNFSNNLASVKIIDNDFRRNHITKTYIIDNKGNNIFGPFTDVVFSEFRNGLALGTKYLPNDCREYFYIDTNGIIIRRDTICDLFSSSHL